MSYRIITDSCANLTDELIESLDLDIIPLSYFIGEKEYIGYQKGVPTDYKTFYDLARKREKITTSQITYEAFEKAFTEVLETVNDFLYIGFSSGLSGSYQAALRVAKDLQKKYPDRKMMVVDSLCASMGQGLLVYHAVQRKNEGKSLEEVAKWVEDNKLRLVHWFTVDDLFFLKRGGRVSATSAVAGTILGIKPVLHVDDEGHLILMEKVRGRKASLNALINHMIETIQDAAQQVIFISHGDCIEDAKYIAEKVRQAINVKDIIINYIDPVIGAHSGPGTAALFFLGSKR